MVPHFSQFIDKKMPYIIFLLKKIKTEKYNQTKIKDLFILILDTQNKNGNFLHKNNHIFYVYIRGDN